MEMPSITCFCPMIKMIRSGTIAETDIAIIRDEIANLERALPWVSADKRLGFHQEAKFYMFTADAIARKLAGLRRLLEMH